MRRLLLLTAFLMLLPACALARFPHGVATVVSACSTYTGQPGSDGCAGANQSALFLAGTYTGNLSGSSVAAGNFYAHATGTSAASGGVGGGQAWTSAHPWNWNSPGVDYPVGNITPVTSMQDPATASSGTSAGQIPPGCAWQPSGHSGSAYAQVYCNTGTNSPLISGFDFGLRGGILLVFSKNVVGPITVSNNHFLNGSVTNAVNGNILINVQPNSTADLVLTNNLIDGNYNNESGVNLIGMISFASTGNITGNYNAFINAPQRPGTLTTCGTIVFDFNYIEGITMNSVFQGAGQHGEFMENVPFPGCTLPSESYVGNTVVIPNTSPAQTMTAPFDMGTGNGNSGIITNATVALNVIVANAASVAAGGKYNPTSSAIADWAWSSFTNVTLGPNYVDLGVSNTGALFCSVLGASAGRKFIGNIDASNGSLMHITGVQANQVNLQLWPTPNGSPQPGTILGTGFTGSPTIAAYGSSGTTGYGPIGGTITGASGGSATLNVTGAVAGQVNAGQTIVGSNLTQFGSQSTVYTIGSQISGTTGGNGAYNLTDPDNKAFGSIVPLMLFPSTYLLSVAQTPGMTFTDVGGNSPITGTETFTGNVSLQTGYAISGFNIQPGSPGCN